MNRLNPPAGKPSRVSDGLAAPPARDPSTLDALLREARRLLAGRDYAEAARRLEVHRPAEWAAVDGSGAQLLRLLGQAQLGMGDWAAARDCLEHLRALERERPQLARDELAAVVSDLCKCYRALNMPEQADACRDEARRLQMGR